MAEITEKQWMNQVRTLAMILGWRPYHTYCSVYSDAGFPDLVLVHTKQRRVIFAELKRDTGRVTERQQAWLDDLAAAGAEVYVWRPSHLDEVEQILRSRPGAV